MLCITFFIDIAFFVFCCCEISDNITREREDEEDICVRCIALLCCIIILIPVCILVIFIDSLHPSMPMFEVDLASINSLNINGSKLTAEWDITLFVKNPNHYHSVSYDNVSIGINYNDKHNLLATTLINPFNQGRYEIDNKRVQLNMDADNDVAAHITSSCSRGVVNVGIVVSTSVKFKGSYHFRRVRPLNVVCEPLSFITSEGHLNGTSNWVLLNGLTCH